MRIYDNPVLVGDAAEKFRKYVETAVPDPTKQERATQFILNWAKTHNPYRHTWKCVNRLNGIVLCRACAWEQGFLAGKGVDVSGRQPASTE
jgi:hypothetical protein